MISVSRVLEQQTQLSVLILRFDLIGLLTSHAHNGSENDIRISYRSTCLSGPQSYLYLFPTNRAFTPFVPDLI